VTQAYVCALCQALCIEVGRAGEGGGEREREERELARGRERDIKGSLSCALSFVLWGGGEGGAVSEDERAKVCFSTICSFKYNIYLAVCIRNLFLFAMFSNFLGCTERSSRARECDNCRC